MPLFTFICFPIIGLRGCYLMVLFYIGSVKFRDVNLIAVLFSSVFVDVVYGDMLGVTYVYGIIMVYVLCDYLNMVCVINRSFWVIWFYFAGCVLMAEIFSVIWIIVSDAHLDRLLVVKQSALSIAVFPCIAWIIGALVKDE